VIQINDQSGRRCSKVNSCVDAGALQQYQWLAGCKLTRSLFVFINEPIMGKWTIFAPIIMLGVDVDAANAKEVERAVVRHKI
jgi:hypothetical protein